MHEIVKILVRTGARRERPLRSPTVLYIVFTIVSNENDPIKSNKTDQNWIHKYHF